MISGRGEARAAARTVLYGANTVMLCYVMYLREATPLVLGRDAQPVHTPDRPDAARAARAVSDGEQRWVSDGK